MRIAFPTATVFLFGCLGVYSQSVDQRISDLRQNVTKIRPDRVPSAAERLSTVLDQTRASLANLSLDPAAAVETVREQRRNMAVLDEAYQREFLNIESKLRGAGLPEPLLAGKLAAWQAFTANYKARMAATLRSFDEVIGAASAHDGAWLHSHANKLIASLGSRGPSRVTGVMDRAPGKLTPRAEAAKAQSVANGPPTPDDLAASGAVVLSPDIVACAKSLGNSPATLFNYVYNNIQYAPYYMLVQSSEAVFWSGRGNDADQATLLIALLRAAGIPARYVAGYFNMPVADAINWLGVKDQATAEVWLNSGTIFTNQGTTFNVRNVWVEAWLNTGSGNAWMPMTPSIKQQTVQPGVTFPEPVFDRTQFLSSVNERLASEVYAQQLLTTFQQAHPGVDFSSAAYTSTIVPQSGDSLPAFPYTPTQIVAIGSTLPTSTIEILMGSSGELDFDQTLAMPSVSTSSVTVGFIAATTNDQAIINRFGGLANVPAGMVNLLPQLLVNEQVVATGTVPLPYGEDLVLQVRHTLPYSSSPDEEDDHSIIVGENAAVTVGFYQISEQLVASRMDFMLSQMTTATPDVISRELVSVAGLRYFQRVELEKNRVFLPLQIVPVLEIPEECETVASVNVTSLFDRPFLVTPGDLLIDAKTLQGRGYDLNAYGADSLTVPRDLSVSRALEAASSGLENALWEELVLIPSISTIKALQINGQAGIPTLVLNSANSSQIGAIEGPTAITSTVSSEVSGGDTVTISEQPTVFGVWTGFGWIDEPAGGFSYAIQQTNSVANGGTTGGNPPTPMPPTGDGGPTGNPTQTNGTNCSDPVTVSNGNMYQQQVDLFASSRGPAILIQRTYNSLAAAQNGPFGYGWTYNYLVSLKDHQTSVTYTNSSGGVFTFELTNGVYVSPPGLDLTLTKSAQGFTLKTKHGTVWQFNSSGRLQSITDRNQNATTLTYNSSNELAAIADALGRTVTFTYNSSGRILSIADFAGRKVTYTYDAQGDLATATDPVGNVTTYAYYTASPFTHLLQTVTKPLGNSTSFEYFANGQAARVSDSAGRNMRFFYLPLANETMFVDPRGYTTTFYYNSLGNVTRLVKADGNYVNYTYTADAQMAAFTDEDGYTSQLGYDSLGNPTSITDALGKVTTLTYDPTFSQVTSIKNALGATIQYQYDAHGNLTGVTEPLGISVHFTYDSFGDRLTATDGEGNTSRYKYDGSGNLQSYADPLNNVTKFEHDTLRRPTAVTDALGNSGSLEWDALSRVAKSVNALGNSWSRTFDRNGNVSETSDANGNTASFSYNVLDGVAQVKDSNGSLTQYGYVTPNCGCSADTELTYYRDAAGATHTQSYDLNQWLLGTTDAAGRTTSFVYDARGDLISRTDANGNIIRYQYDGAHRLLQKTFPDGTTAKFTYDALGNVLTAENANTTLTFTYDALNRVVTATDSRFQQTIKYTYDSDNRRTVLTDPSGGVTTYSYDANSRITAVANRTGGSAQFTYDANGRRATLKYSNGLITSYQYDKASELEKINTTGAGPKLSYSYDANGNPKAMADASGTHTYKFDPLNRLTEAANPGAASETYSYDGAGNRLSSASGSYTYDSAGRLTAGEADSFTYDNNGNLISRKGANGTTTYSYDFENRLIAIQLPDGSTAAYQYDAVGRRIQKKVGGTVTNYLYDGFDILLELSANGGVQARYTRGPVVDEMLTMERNGQTYFYHSNAIGSVVMLTDASGKSACSYTYDSFGRIQGCTGVTNPFTYGGRENDSESGLYYMRARYYDPATGRFLSVDPLNLASRLMLAQYGAGGALFVQGSPQMLNEYSYAINNPLVYNDASGAACSGPPIPLKTVGIIFDVGGGFDLGGYGTQYEGGGVSTGYSRQYYNNNTWSIINPNGQQVLGPFPSNYTYNFPPTQNLYVYNNNGALVTVAGLYTTPPQNVPGYVNVVQSVVTTYNGVVNGTVNSPPPTASQQVNAAGQALQQAGQDLENYFITQPLQTIQQNWNNTFNNGNDQP